MPRKSTKTKNIKLVEENVETTDTQTTQEVTAEETVTENITTTNTDPNRGEIIDVEWEQVQPIFEFKKKLEELETYFGNMCIHFEKEKANIISQINYGQNDLYMMAQQVQKSKNIDESLTYELKLPTEFGEKGFFVRKDD